MAFKREKALAAAKKYDRIARVLGPALLTSSRYDLPRGFAFRYSGVVSSGLFSIIDASGPMTPRGRATSSSARTSKPRKRHGNNSVSADEEGLVVEPEAAASGQHGFGGVEVVAFAGALLDAFVFDLGDVDRGVPGGEQ